MAEPATAPVDTSPVVVSPKPAADSTVITLNKRLAWSSFLAALLPTLLEILFNALSEPTAAGMIASWFPYEARAAVLLILPIALKAIADRKTTGTPIAGTPLAAELARSPETMQLMSVPTNSAPPSALNVG